MVESLKGEVMVKIEDHCVGCPREIGCLGQLCPYQNVEVHYCDICGDESPEYMVEDKEYCESCAEDYVDGYFKGLTISEKMEIAEELKIIHKKEIE